MHIRWCALWLVVAAAPLRCDPPAAEYRRRVDAVRTTSGFVALWDFVNREDGPSGKGRFTAYQPAGRPRDFALDAVNYVRDYWGQGRAALYDDFPLLGSGPFGQAIRVVAEKDPNFRPCLLVPRERLHDSGLDVKGPGRSVSMVVWMVRESGNHAIAGIWHEGTDLESAAAPVQRVERGRRQYALFTGLAANNAAVAVHVSENGGSSFGDRYARNLAVTKQKIPEGWVAAGFVFDNARNTVTAYLDGVAEDYWVDDPERHPFFQWPAKGWKQALYTPPEGKPLERKILSQSGDESVELRRFAWTKVRVTLQRDKRGRWKEKSRELVSLRVNPFWFGHDLYAPKSVADGGPFTIGRVIHSSRSVGSTGYIGGVAVFGKALSARDMARLSAIGRGRTLSFAEVVP
jgi:hypothetical protein